MNPKKKEVDVIFEAIGYSNNKRLGRCFQTRKNKYYYDTGTGKVFEVNDDVYYVFKKILDNANKDSLFDDPGVTVEALREVRSSIVQENILKAPILEGFIGTQVTDLEEQLREHRAQVTLHMDGT